MLPILSMPTILVALTLGFAAAAPALAGPQPPAGPAPITVSAAPDAPDWIAASGTARFQLSRAVTVDEGRVAVLVGDTDWSSLVDTVGTSLDLRPAAVGFPRGETAVVVYLVSPAHEWREVGRTTLRVLSDRGFERAVAAPTAEVGLAGQAALRRTPEQAPTPRDTFQDLSVRLGLDTTHARNGWVTTSQARMVGVSNQEQALRFGTRGDEAPRLDLGSYQFGVRNRVGSLAVGHGTFGTHRLLLNTFASRGLSGSLQLGPVVDVSLAAVNGSTLVGFGNLLGVGESQHRVVNGTLGIELVPTRRGALRVAAAVMNGSVLPETNVNQGAIRDAEESRGLGVQVTSRDVASRFQLDAGLARSRFVNPRDPGAPPGLAIVPTVETTRTARYLDASYALIQGAKLGESATASLTAAVRHSRVDPLYRSVALPVRADLEQNAVDLTAGLGAFSSQLTYDRSRDNLAAIASVLTTESRQLLWSSALPLQTFASGNPNAAAWPTLTYALSRMHQYGVARPVGGLFDSDSQVPDQMSTNHVVGVGWQGAVWRGGYGFNRSLQDNRQPGRERADLLNAVHSVNLGAMASTRLDLGVEVAFEDADNQESARTDLTRRVSVNALWRPATRTSLAAVITRNRLEDNPATSERRTTDVNFTFTQGVVFMRSRPDSLQGQFFVRYVRQTIYGLVLGLPDASDTQFWSLNTGLTFRIF